ncbi:MAG: anti-sigma-D factor RsdA, partial [Mycobacterium sp.]
RGLTVIGSAAATVLTLGGFGSVVAGSQPGDALYSLRSMLFGEPKSVVDDRIVLTAKTELDKVQQMIAQGQWDQAQQRLTSLGDTVQTVSDTQRKQDLVDQWNRLNVQVQKRDPNAVPPPSAPPAYWPPEYAPSAAATTSVTLSITPSATPGGPPTSTEPAVPTSAEPAAPSSSTGEPVTTSQEPNTPATGSEPPGQ